MFSLSDFVKIKGFGPMYPNFSVFVKTFPEFEEFYYKCKELNG